MHYLNIIIEIIDQHHIRKWGWMHRDYLETEHPNLYQQLILKGTFGRHLADIKKSDRNA
jgi:hypothetical protein